MLVAESRPRNLSWLHSGPLLFGDWGTSRLYVLGLAFYYTAHASIYYLAVMSLIMAGVAWGYTIICRCFPDGGGVYSAARSISPLLSVVAATLLLCDFIITASLSAIEAYHYFGVHGKGAIIAASIGTITVLGLLNWFGARAAGRFALFIAVIAIAASAIIGAMCLPLLPIGLSAAKPIVTGVDDPWKMWESLVRIVLALSGVEAVASMTGLMKKPVARTAKRTLWPVLIEVVILNLIFCIALNALPGRLQTSTPDYVTYEQEMNLNSDLTPKANATPDEIAAYEAVKAETLEIKKYRTTAVKVLADYSATRLFGETVGNAVGIAAGIIFGLLLLSAVNTAILAMVSVYYALARDGELPKVLTKLNYSGVPWVGLLLAVGAPAVVLLFVNDDKALGELYAIGVVGAIAINFVCCAWNRELPITVWERRGLWFMGGLMSVIGLTIVYAKPNATAFAGSIIGVVLIARWLVRAKARRAALIEPLPTPSDGWLALLRQTSQNIVDKESRIMLAARGRDHAEFAVELAKKRGAALFVIYVRTLRMLDVQPGQIPRIEDDPDGQEALGTVALIAQRASVPIVPIYVTSPNVAEEILDYTVTYGCDTLIMGRSRRSLFSKRIEGNVLLRVAEDLPEGVSLITRATPTVENPRGLDPTTG